MVLRTLAAMRKKDEVLPLLPEYKNDDDKAFVKRLFAAAAVGYDENLKIVEQYTKNWDVERIALMDNIIMTTAIAELLGFDSIPVKVTLDEYIEIAKYYSTLGSSTFINGILDKISTDMTADGRIAKQGRGLVEF
jgi:N utilization substance protein B